MNDEVFYVPTSKFFRFWELFLIYLFTFEIATILDKNSALTYKFLNDGNVKTSR